MYDVLLPVDRSRHRALHQARYVERLAEDGADVRATVLYVVPPEEFETEAEVAVSSVDSVVDAAERLEDAGIDVERTVGDGSVAEEILRIADDRDADEVVMGGRKRSGVAEVLLGSTVQDVMLSTERAVTVTGEDSDIGEGMRTVLLPVDKNEERALAQAEYVANLPHAPDGVEATVFYVFPHQGHKGAPDHDFEEIDAAVAAADRLEEAGIAVERAWTGGEVVQDILAAADDLGADGIVMAGRKRSGVTQVLLGSTTLDVVLSAGRPVTLTG